MHEQAFWLPTRTTCVLLTRLAGGSPSNWDAKTVGTYEACRSNIELRRREGHPAFEAAIIELQPTAFVVLETDGSVKNEVSPGTFADEWKLAESLLHFKVLGALSTYAITHTLNPAPE